MISIQRHLTLLLGVGFVMLLLLSSGTIYFVARHFLVSEFDAALRVRAEVIASGVELVKGRLKVDLPEMLSQGFTPKNDGEYFELWTGSGQKLARSPSLGTLDLPRNMANTVTTAGHFKEQLQNVELPNNSAGRAISMAFFPAQEEREEHAQQQSGSNPATMVTLVLARDRHGLDRTLFLLQVLLISVCLLTLACMVALVKIAIKRGLAPLGRVADQAAHIDAKSLNQRFSVNPMPDELRPICERLNDLLSRLESSFERERRFSADIAHELRTPVAELRVLAEVARQFPDNNRDAKIAFEDAFEIAETMQQIVTGLLTLVHCENRQQLPQSELIELGSFIAPLWKRAEERAKTKDIKVCKEIPSDIAVVSDRALLHIIVSNLLANAVEYTPVGGAIAFTAREDSGQAQLILSNTVINLSSNDLAHLFERFWRKDMARTDSSHTGLGLAICQEAASLLGTSIKAELPDPTTLQISLLLQTR